MKLKFELPICDFCNDSSVIGGTCYNDKCEIYRKEVIYST